MKNYLRCLLFTFFIVSCNERIWCQPFVDLFQVRYMQGIGNKTTPDASFTHLWFGCDLPVRLKKDTYLVLSPSHEIWHLDVIDNEYVPDVYSLALPIGMIAPFRNSKFSFVCFGIPRWNGEKIFQGNAFQIGGAALAVYEIRHKQKIRLGVYANTEFFGLYIIPLAGVDWKLNERNYLFGNLPGRLTYEHKWANKFYGGITFRAVTNSYRLSSREYIRIDDNQLSVYLDYYFSKNFCLTLEPGFGIFRKLRKGVEHKIYLSEPDWSDGLFVKLSTSYRIRL